MSSICFYFQVHQPYRIRRFTIFDSKKKKTNYFDALDDHKLNNEVIFNKVAKKCYIPANKTLLEIIKKYPEFKISFSFSGVFLDQAEKYLPEVIDSFKELIETKNVEVLSETYYHSLAFLYSKLEFENQVKKHSEKIQQLFGVKPQIFRNTELIYNNELAKYVEEMGYKGILAEGADHILNWRNSNFIYRPKGTENISLLLKNYKLSDDIAFRFSNTNWEEHPLTIEKFTHWINQTNGSAHTINLFMDYETFGEHQWEDTGIFEFLKKFPKSVLKHPHNNFVTPSEAIDTYSPMDEIDIPQFISWADVERDLSAWLSNSMQRDALDKLYELEKKVLEVGDYEILEDWRRMQTSDHFYYMCTKWFEDGDVHKYFNPYESPYEAFITFMNVYQDLKFRLEKTKRNLKLLK